MELCTFSSWLPRTDGRLQAQPLGASAWQGAWRVGYAAWGAAPVLLDEVNSTSAVCVAEGDGGFL